jgi:hypothetical protein
MSAEHILGLEMLRVEVDERVDPQLCEHCGREFMRVYGSLFEDNRRAGIYSADLHEQQHDPQNPCAMVTLGTMGWGESAQEWQKYSIVIEIWATDSEFQMSVREKSAFPYDPEQADVQYWFGSILGREEALASPWRDEFFHMADHIADGDVRIKGHLNRSPTGTR